MVKKIVKELSAKDFEILYWKVQMSTKELGEKFDSSRKTISKYMEQKGVERRSFRDNRSGRKNGNWNRKTVECRECGKNFEVNKYQIENGRKYCSESCKGKSRGRQIKGSNNPSYKGGDVESDPCRWCGETKMVRPSVKDRPFCGKNCYDKWQSEYRKGTITEEDNPMWQENPSREYRYGRNWNGQRRKALDRDNHECQLCRSVKNLEVHHKKPIATFDRSNEKWYKEANKIQNLITLCRSCHANIHANEGQSKIMQYAGTGAA